MIKKFNKIILLRNVIILVFMSLLTLIIINRTGKYPWGSDTYGHLFKSNILYDTFKNGNLFVNYNESWYNGVQPFRYWAPLPYYILAIINLITKDIIITYNVFIAFVFILGGFGWLCWGYYLKRQNLAIILAILWFFIPNNLRVLFSEGNIPYVVVNTLIPFVFLYYYKSVNEETLVNHLLLAIFMFIVTLSHAMLSAMTGISLFLFALFNCIINRKYFKNFVSLTYAFLGIMLSCFWLYPALKGGILGLSKTAVANVMESLTYPLNISLNPLLRFENIEIYYFGLAFAAIAVFGIFMSNKNQRSAFITSIVILLGTTKVALPILQKLSINQLFWMNRFTSIAMATIIVGIILWKKLRRSVLVLFIVLLIIDSSLSFYVLGFNGQFPDSMSKTLDIALNISTQRIGVLDCSHFGSFPSYYIPYNSVKPDSKQIYGWAWQGASTAKNIVTINTALERGYYELMFDRALELGADTLIVKKSLINDFDSLENAAYSVGYKKYFDEDKSIIYKYPNVSEFGTEVKYKGIAIGSYSSNIQYIFPTLYVGNKEFLDDYTYDELKDNKIVYLSGFKYRDKKVADDLVLKLSRNGVKVIVDVTGFDNQVLLDVRAIPLIIKNNYHEIYYANQILAMEDFPEKYKEWKACFLSGIENDQSYGVIENRLVNYIGKKDNDNLIFMGFNLPYYVFLTKDKNAVTILEKTFELIPFKVPDRQIQHVKIEREKNVLKIISDKSNVIVPIAALDAFERMSGDYNITNNLIHLKTSKLEIKIIYPYLTIGIMLSIMFLVIMIVLSVILKKSTLIQQEVN